MADSPSGAARQPLWYCHECQREMQPLMVPDPTCVHCRGTFVEQLPPSSDSDPNHDPRQWASQGPLLDDEWVDEGEGAEAGMGLGQLLGQLFGGAAAAANTPGGGGQPFFFGGGGPGAVPDDQYDGENPFAEGATNHDGVRSPRGEREGGGEPGVDSPAAGGSPQRPMRQPQRNNSNPVDFLQALFGPQANQQQQQPQEDRPQSPAAGPSNQQNPSGVRTFTRTFGSNDGTSRGGTFSVTFGTPSGLGGQVPRPQAQARTRTGEGAAGQETEDGRVPVRSLASFLHQAFGAPPPLERQQPRRSPSDPSANRPPPNRDTDLPSDENPFTGAAGGLGAEREQMPFDYLMTILNVLNGAGGAGGAGGRMGDFVFSENGFQDLLNQLMQQAEGRYGPQPASEDKIKGLVRIKMTKEMLAAPTVTDCAVCKDEFVEGEECIALPCKHLFHAEDCLIPWLQRNGSCPVCRYSLVDDPTDDPADASPTDPTTPASPSYSPTSPRSPVRQGSTSFSPPIEGSILPGAFPTFASPVSERQGDVEMTPPPEEGASGSGKSARELAAEAAERRQKSDEPSASGSGGAPTQEQDLMDDLD